MGFGKKLTPIGKGNYPVRQWEIVGYPDTGKSTFVAQMRGPILVIDPDQRFQEVVRAGVDAILLSDQAHEMLDPQKIYEILMKEMPKASIGTIAIDSLTGIIEPLVTQTLIDNARGQNKNYAAGFRDKALAMRQLQNAITRWGTDVAWVYHYRDGGDNRGATKRSTTISTLELARLRRNINMKIELRNEQDTYFAKVLFARGGRSNIEFKDDSGYWEGIPERIEEEVYGGLSAEERASLMKQIPSRFHSAEDAIGWAWEYSQENGKFFNDAQHAKNSYEKLKRELKEIHGDGLTAQEMWDSWISKVQDKSQGLE